MVRFIKLLVVSLLVILMLMTIGCQDFQPLPTSQLTPKPTEKAPPTTVVRTEDRAILAVYEHLLSQAGSQKAKLYLADFYTICDNWTAKSEILKDGSTVWYVVVDMTRIKPWEQKPYWQQAGWFVFQEGGKVIPSSRLKANALRIEADLQELSLPAKP